jgi:hypothetical protein
MAIRSATPGSGTAGGFQAPPAAATSAQSTALTIPVKLPNGTIVNVGTQAEVEALRMAVQNTQMVDLSKPAGGAASSTSNIIDIAADGFQAVGGFLAGSKYSRLLQDTRDARDDLVTAREALARESGTSTALLAALDAQLNYLDTAVELLNAQITAVDMMAGGATAKVISKLMDGSGGFGGGSGLGTAVAVGAGGLGLGLLLSNNNSNNNSSSRRR